MRLPSFLLAYIFVLLVEAAKRGGSASLSSPVGVGVGEGVGVDEGVGVVANSVQLGLVLRSATSGWR